MTAAASTSSGLDDLRARIAALQTRFVELGTRAASAAEDVRSGGTPPSEELLAQLATAAQDFQALRDDVLETAASVEVVLPKPADRLAECQAAARSLHEDIAASPGSESDVIGWAERLRPFAALLEMLEGKGAVDDERFTQLADSVADAFGRPLATAATRGRLRLG